MRTDVTRIPSGIHRRRRGLVEPMRIDPTGRIGPTEGQSKRARYRRSSRGLYVPSWVDATVPEQRIVEAAAVLPAYGAVTGWAGLRWLGGRWFAGTRADGTYLPVTLAATGIRPQSGIAVSEERLNAVELIGHDGLVVTRALRSGLFEMRYAPDLWSAVVVADMAAFSDLFGVDEMRAYALAHGGMTGIPQARDATALAVENSWSPMETIMRLVWELVAELPRPLANQPVFDLQGRHLGTPDLLDVESGTYGEYDGPFHLETGRRIRDIRREDLFRRAGLEGVTMMAGEPGGRGAVAERILATRERSLRAGRERLWTIEQPPWWIPTETVAQRRALTQSERSRLLAHRAA